MFYHAFDGYMNHAFPKDELKPLSCKGEDTLGGYALTLVRSTISSCLMFIGNHVFSWLEVFHYFANHVSLHRSTRWIHLHYLVIENGSVHLLNGLVKIFDLILWVRSLYLPNVKVNLSFSICHVSFQTCTWKWSLVSGFKCYETVTFYNHTWTFVESHHEHSGFDQVEVNSLNLSVLSTFCRLHRETKKPSNFLFPIWMENYGLVKWETDHLKMICILVVYEDMEITARINILTKPKTWRSMTRILDRIHDSDSSLM